MFTPDHIEELKENEVFVFGSNLAGNHAGGAAHVALKKFGAIYGLGEGLAGNSYAFPTLDRNMQRLSFERLVEAKDELYRVANKYPEKTFFVTKVGTGIAGIPLDEMRRVFEGEKPPNIVLPKEFY